ncbi:hypothetical protein [Bifidobacterium simiiventris]|uniref:hypothetical protein n=1 Tax=Bifidobacterium simiiventris TaxID=2834434 RepID=UPI001C5892A5|nr:hypothetical protein [Bifidobacterium simiiventris]MBW3079667.1 hypothetical protein [Bifidobacterium simiiventris]
MKDIIILLVSSLLAGGGYIFTPLADHMRKGIDNFLNSKKVVVESDSKLRANDQSIKSNSFKELPFEYKIFFLLLAVVIIVLGSLFGVEVNGDRRLWKMIIYPIFAIVGGCFLAFCATIGFSVLSGDYFKKDESVEEADESETDNGGAE